MAHGRWSTVVGQGDSPDTDGFHFWTALNTDRVQLTNRGMCVTLGQPCFLVFIFSELVRAG
jgi:hypothetical protein